jgi:aspartate racemase
MKIAGMIGGVGPESTIDYYHSIIRAYREQVRDDTYPHLIINSIDLSMMVRFFEANDLASVITTLVNEIEKLARAGADFAFISANTPHVVFDDLRSGSPIPLISIVQATAEAARALGLKKVGLFGTRFTMQGRFYPDVLSRAGISVAVPDPEEQAVIHDKYMNELVKGIFLPETRERLLAIAKALQERHGAEGVILGGTELPLLLNDVKDRGVPFLDTTHIHVQAVVRELLS